MKAVCRRPFAVCIAARAALDLVEMHWVISPVSESVVAWSACWVASVNQSASAGDRFRLENSMDVPVTGSNSEWVVQKACDGRADVSCDKFAMLGTGALFSGCSKVATWLATW